MASTDSVTTGVLSGSSVDVLGNTVTFKAVSADTAGAYSLVEAVSVPGAGTPPHKQHDDDEAFFILEGVYTIHLGDSVRTARPGDYVFVPRGTLHAFRNEGSVPARMLIINSPGGLHEAFFAEVGVPAGSDAAPPDFPTVLESAARYGIEIMLP